VTSTDVLHVPTDAPTDRSTLADRPPAPVDQPPARLVTLRRSKSSRRRRIARSLVPPLVAIAALLAAWEGYVHWRGDDQYAVVAPTAMVAALADDPGFYVRHGQTTLLEALCGLGLGGGIAFVAAALMSQFRVVERALMPLAVLVKVTPMVAVAPLLIVWLGFGLAPKVLIAAVISFFPILVNCITGFRAIDPHVHEVVRSVDASRAEVFFRLRLPQCLPHLFAALKICVTLSLIGALVSELQGSSRGLGNVITQAAMYLDMERMYAAIATLAVMGLALTGVVTFLEHRALRWLGLGHVDDH
jgi:NitT/TauT family transport system permease protein